MHMLLLPLESPMLGLCEPQACKQNTQHVPARHQQSVLLIKHSAATQNLPISLIQQEEL